MTTDRSARAEVIDLDAFRRAQQAKIVKRSNLLHDAMPSRDQGFTLRLATSITLAEASAIAQGIVEKFSTPGSLFKAFMERRQRELEGEGVVFVDALMQRKRIVSGYSPEQLKALLALYKKNPTAYIEIYIVPAAEEFLNRFRVQAEEV